METPTPMTAHPRYEGEDAEAIRGLMRMTNHISWAYQVGQPLAEQRLEPGAVEMSRVRFRMLHVHRCWGPAPFVGDPQATRGGYFWEAALDEIGGWVAGPARLWLESSSDG